MDDNTGAIWGMGLVFVFLIVMAIIISSCEKKRMEYEYLEKVAPTAEAAGVHTWTATDQYGEALRCTESDGQVLRCVRLEERE